MGEVCPTTIHTIPLIGTIPDKQEKVQVKVKLNPNKKHTISDALIAASNGQNRTQTANGSRN
jgi:hypothetical protein